MYHIFVFLFSPCFVIHSLKPVTDVPPGFTLLLLPSACLVSVKLSGRHFLHYVVQKVQMFLVVSISFLVVPTFLEA